MLVNVPLTTTVENAKYSPQLLGVTGGAALQQTQAYRTNASFRAHDLDYN